MKMLSGKCEAFGFSCFVSSICLLCFFVQESTAQGTMDALTPSFTVVSGPPNSHPYSDTALGYVVGGAGWTFTPTEDLWVTAISSTAPQVDFWIGSNELASFNYSVSNYNYSLEPITPILLMAGQEYSITTQYPNFTYSIIINAGSLTGDGGPLVSLSPYISLNGYSMLSTSGQLTTYSSDAVLLGPNFQFQAVPEPSTISLSIITLFIATRRNRLQSNN